MSGRGSSSNLGFPTWNFQAKTHFSPNATELPRRALLSKLKHLYQNFIRTITFLSDWIFGLQFLIVSSSFLPIQSLSSSHWGSQRIDEISLAPACVSLTKRSHELPTSSALYDCNRSLKSFRQHSIELSDRAQTGTVHCLSGSLLV